MKKKIALMVTSLVLVVAMAVGGTLAYLTAESELKVNTFTVGHIGLTLEEPKWDYEGSSAKIYPGAEIDKDPTVTISPESEDCYVRMIVKVTESDTLDALFGAANLDLTSIFAGYDANDWAVASNVKVDGVRTYEFRYYGDKADENGVVKYSETDTELEPLFTQVVIPDTLTSEQVKALDEFNIEIIAHAIQAEEFGSAGNAWENFDAE